MRKLGIVAIILVAALFAFGCASNKMTTTRTTQDERGNPVTTTVQADITDSAKFHQAQERIKIAAMKNQKPIVEITIPEGATLKAEGGDIKIASYVPLRDTLGVLTQYREPWLEGAAIAAPAITALGMSYFETLKLAELARFKWGDQYNWDFNDSFKADNQSSTPFINGVGHTYDFNSTYTTPAPVVVPPVVNQPVVVTE